MQDQALLRFRFDRRFWALNIAVWTLLATTSIMSLATDLIRAGRPFEWKDLIFLNAAAFTPWIWVTPLVFLWIDRFPPAGASWARLLMRYFPILIIWLLFYLPVEAVILGYARHGAFQPVLEAIRRFPANQIAIDGIYLIALVGVAVAARQGRERSWREQQASDLKLENAGLEARLSAARLEMLRAQLEPHFLYNALNSISALIHQGLPDKATEAVDLLSELLRYATRATEQESVPLSEEIDFAESYLSFQKIRYGGRLELHIDIETETLALPLPPLILQPLLENAIRHGVETLSASSRVELLARRVGPEVEIAVINYPGSESRQQGLGVGLRNVESRLQWHYRRPIDIELRPTGELSGYSQGGYAARLHLPAGAI